MKNNSDRYVGKCPICLRPMLSGPFIDEHHLIPKSKKGKEKITLHRVCHQKIHSCITEIELARYYHTVERLLENEEIQKFVKWISKKDPDYYDSSKDTYYRKSKKRRK